MSDWFGDAEAADAFCAEGEADPLYVAIRLHEFRKSFSDNFGSGLDPWHALSDFERMVAYVLATWLLEELAMTDVAAEVAERFHNRVAEHNDRPMWDDISIDDRVVAILLVNRIITWLTLEGTRP